MCDSVKQDKQECAGHLIVPPPACLCSDIPVQGGPNRTSCAEQYNVGNCNAAFIKDTIEDIPEGYCQLTCGKCGCSSTITQVLQKLQANTFLQAATQTGMKAQFDLPGFTATVMAPSDAAFTTALKGFPLSSMTNEELLALLQLHVLPPVPTLMTPWTTPFFVTNPSLPTWLGAGNTLVAGRATAAGINFTVSAPIGPAANIITADQEAGRSFVNLLDGVLALPANAVPVPLPAAGSGPNNGIGIVTFNMTTPAAPPAMAVSTAG
ncbi:hypothetical protein ABBQ32_000460 [Trebouxia sp. C0010 RCD-2024]